MVTLGSFQSPTFQAFHGSASPYDEALSCRSLELALEDAASASARSGVEERPRDGPKQAPTRRISVLVSDNSGSEEADRPRAPTAYTASSASHRLFRTMKRETSSSWKACSPSEEGGAAKLDVAADSSSWKTPDAKAHPVGTPTQDAASGRFDDKSPSDSKATGHDDKPSNANEILDGSDVLQQISNVTSTEPSNEREVFVGGLRESEDSVHITEEELATYFSRFGIIESVSINRDDRTHRGRGFAFVKFFQESAALNAVMADASTHVIRGTTVSVQWSRGAKDAGGDRPRRRNSGSSGNNGGSPSRGANRSSPKMGNFSGAQKGAGHRGGSSCGSSCTHGYSPHRSRSQGHLHPSGGGVPYAYCPGHGTDHMNQQLVCVMVPAQRAAALGLPHHTHSLGSCTSRSGSSGDVHFVPLAQSNGGHSGYPSHTRSRSHTPSSPCHAGGGYGPYAQPEHHPINIPHHPPQKTNHPYPGHPAMHMPPVHESQRRGRGEPRGHAPHCGSGSGGSSSYSEYERLQYEFAHPHNNSYPPQEWSNDGTVRAMRHGMMRSQSPPTLMRTSQGRSGGGAPRPPATTLPQPYDSPYCYGASGHSSSGAVDGFTGVSTSGRRHSGSTAMNGRHSMPQDGLTPSSFYFSAGDCGNEHAYDRDYGYAGPSRMP